MVASRMLKTVRVLAENGPVRVELARARDRLVVMKRLFGFHPELERRLEREAEVVRKLDHPNVLPILDVRDGALIYPYVPGVSLADALDRGPLSPERALHIAAAVLDALAYAHELGIIHNDVKPGNVILRGEQVLLLDFGFAKDVGLAAITSSQTALGTPSYMAPEQFAGHRTDPRSDLYGVGALVYHAITGAPPYGRDVLRVLVGDRTVPLAPLAAELEPIDRWLRGALAIEPADRYACAQDMLDAIPLKPQAVRA